MRTITPLAVAVCLAAFTARQALADPPIDPQALYETPNDFAPDIDATLAPAEGGDIHNAGPVNPIPATGHGAPPHILSTGYYDIWSRNCHTAANSFVALASHYAKFQSGILVCMGQPESSPEYHTASWLIKPSGQTCIYNWGKTCCWEAPASPPDISQGQGQECAKRACGSQYRAHGAHSQPTRALPDGKLVEWPGPTICAAIVSGASPDTPPGFFQDAINLEQLDEDLQSERVKALIKQHAPLRAQLDLSAGKRPACLSCCDHRAELWSKEEWGEGKHKTFRMRCLRACTAIFDQP